MYKLSKVYGILTACLVVIQSTDVYSRETSLEASVDARAEYNDNIFLTSSPHDDVTGITVTPLLAGIIKEENWEAKLNARIRSNNYSDHDLDSNDQLFDLIGSYKLERNIFSLNVNYDLDSNLTATSTDFGVVGQRVNRKNQSISPQYTRLLSERSALALSYTYSDVDYLEAEDTAYIPYNLETAVATILYNLTEINKLTISLQGIDYASKNDQVTYQLLQTRFGIDHHFSETLSADFLIGVSRRDSTNLITQQYDFFGNVIVQTQEIDVRNRGFVLDAGITKLLEKGKIEGRISRDNTTDSFGGLNQVDRLKLNYLHKFSSRWSLNLNGRYEDVTAITSGAQDTARDVFFFESIARYSISRNWDINASYRYIQRRFKSDTSDDRAPYSNRVFVGLTYNFPSLSTF